jgi:hypothetical protein
MRRHAEGSSLPLEKQRAMGHNHLRVAKSEVGSAFDHTQVVVCGG